MKKQVTALVLTAIMVLSLSFFGDIAIAAQTADYTEDIAFLNSLGLCEISVFDLQS